MMIGERAGSIEINFASNNENGNSFQFDFVRDNCHFPFKRIFLYAAAVDFTGKKFNDFHNDATTVRFNSFHFGAVIRVDS